MPWNDSTETLVAVGGQVSVAPLGTPLPANPTAALNAAFVGLGYTSEDGVSFQVARDITDLRAWQSFDPVRRVMTGRTIQATFALLQWNEATVPFAFGGGTVTGAGPYKYELPEPEDGLDERSLVIDAVDGTVHTRILLPRVIVVENVETNFQRAQLSELPITVGALAPEVGKIVTILSDAPGFAAGS